MRKISVLAEATQLKQVIVNLALNALDAMEASVVRTLEFHVMPRGEFVLLTVSDSGEGIAPANVSRIFDPFFTTKGPDRGTGLGLSVTLSIIKQHGGEIRVDSVIERGTVFTIQLPMAVTSRENCERARGVTQPPPMAAGASILVIDDERPAATLLQRVLAKRFGCAAEIVSDGRMAIERLRNGRYTAIISDVRMPLVDGVQLFEWVLVNRPDLVSRIMFTTGDAGQSELNSKIARLNIPVLQKPFTIEALERQVERLLNQPLQAI